MYNKKNINTSYQVQQSSITSSISKVEKMKIYLNASFSVLAYSTSSPGVVLCLDII